MAEGEPLIQQLGWGSLMGLFSFSLAMVRPPRPLLATSAACLPQDCACLSSPCMCPLQVVWGRSGL